MDDESSETTGREDNMAGAERGETQRQRDCDDIDDRNYVKRDQLPKTFRCQNLTVNSQYFSFLN